MKPLRFPDHFPPKDKWGKFFLGVRWLGPDLSFFKELKAEQGTRSQEDFVFWGNGLRRDLAMAISRALTRQLGWKSAVFIPEDSVAVAFHGPRFDFNDPESAFEEVVELLDRDFAIRVPDSFWASKSDVTMGELIDELVLQQKA